MEAQNSPSDRPSEGVSGLVQTFEAKFTSRVWEYKRVGMLGRGSYGTVHEVEINGRNYALKIQEAEGLKIAAGAAISRESGYVGLPRSGLREVDFMKRFQHPNFLKVIHVFVDHEMSRPRLCFLCEKANMSLRRTIQIRNKDDLTRQEFVSLVHQIFVCLEFLERIGYMHCDIGPHNFLVFGEKAEAGVKRAERSLKLC